MKCEQCGKTFTERDNITCRNDKFYHNLCVLEVRRIKEERSLSGRFPNIPKHIIDGADQSLIRTMDKAGLQYIVAYEMDHEYYVSTVAPNIEDIESSVEQLTNSEDVTDVVIIFDKSVMKFRTQSTFKVIIEGM